MSKTIRFSNTETSHKSDRELFFDYKVIGFIDYSWDYKNVFPILTGALPELLTLNSAIDLALTTQQIKVIHDTCRQAIHNLIKDKQAYPDGTTGDIMSILGKNIRINLKDSQDKIIHTFFGLFQVTEECLIEGKPMYYSVIENN
jgi:hypothetical protein